MGKCCSNSEVEMLLAFEFFDAEDRELFLVSLCKMLGSKYRGCIRSFCYLFVMLLLFVSLYRLILIFVAIPNGTSNMHNQLMITISCKIFRAQGM